MIWNFDLVSHSYNRSSICFHSRRRFLHTLSKKYFQRHGRARSPNKTHPQQACKWGPFLLMRINKNINKTHSLLSQMKLDAKGFRFQDAIIPRQKSYLAMLHLWVCLSIVTNYCPLALRSSKGLCMRYLDLSRRFWSHALSFHREIEGKAFIEAQDKFEYSGYSSHST